MREIVFCVGLAFAAGGTVPAGSDAPTTKPAPNPKLAAMPANSWLRIGDPPPAPRGIMAYSGAVFDTAHNVLLLFGGGHADYWGNEVCAFDVSALTWKKMYEPDAQDRYVRANIDHVQGKLKDSDKPYTRHSYQMLAFVPSVKRMFIWSGCGPGWGTAMGPQCVSPPDSWYYDYERNAWELVATNGPKCYGGGTCYDPTRDCLWALPGESWPKLWKFDVKSKQWSSYPLKPESAATCHLNLDYSPKQDLIVAGIGEKGVSYVIDPKTFRVEKADTTAFQPLGWGGQTYLPAHDMMLSLAGENRLGVFDFKTRKWYPVMASNEGPKMMGYAVYGRFNYTPIDRVALFVGPAGTWAYRPPAAFDLAPASGQVEPSSKPANPSSP